MRKDCSCYLTGCPCSCVQPPIDWDKPLEVLLPNDNLTLKARLVCRDRKTLTGKNNLVLVEEPSGSESVWHYDDSGKSSTDSRILRNVKPRNSYHLAVLKRDGKLWTRLYPVEAGHSHVPGWEVVFSTVVEV